MANNSSRIVTGLGVPNAQTLTGTGSPLNVVSASVGAIYTNLADGSLWTKTSGTNTTTGWVAGASAPTVVSISASATASSWNQIILVDATSGAVTVTLPTAVSNEGKSIEVKKIDSTNNAVIVDANAAETIDGQATQTISQQYHNARFISNGTNVIRESVDNGVVAEYGAVQIDNQIFSGSDTFVNSTNGIYALPSAGVWLLTYDLSTDSTGANTTSNVAIHSPTATVVSGSERVRGGGVTTTATLSCAILVSTTGAATYRLVGRRGGSGSMTIINSALTTSGITWQKVGGYAPIEGQIVDYLRARRISAQTFTAVDQAVAFATVDSGNIPLNTSNGQITLSAGKTYILRGGVNSVTGVVAPRATFGWFNVTSGIYTGNSTSFYSPSDSAANGAGGGVAEAIITPTVTTIVEFRLNGGFQGGIGIGVGDFNAPGGSIGWATVQQLGSSAYNTLNAFTGATSLVDGVSGGVPTPVAGQNSMLLVGDGTWGTSLIGKRSFTSGTTYTPTSGTNKIVAYVVGGGGGGGNCASSVSTFTGGGGGAGGVIGFIEDVSDQTTYTYAIGAAGAAAGNGGNTTITVNGNTYTANGGSAGANGTAAAPSITGSGTGGTTSPAVVTGNAFLVARGGAGFPGIAVGTNSHTTGTGGSNMFGSGGIATGTNAAGSANGNAGIGHGAGGSGSRQNDTTAVSGGVGVVGMLLIFEMR